MGFLGEHPQCRCVPIETRQMEKPTFEVGDRIRINEDGRKGTITGESTYFLYVDFSVPPSAKNPVAGSIPLTSFMVVFDGEPEELRHFPKAYLERHAAKAVKIDGPSAARSTT